MATESPFSFLDSLMGKVAATLQPPAWVVDEVQHRIVLFANHVLMQEPQAQERLARQKGRVVLAQWRNFHLKVEATPAGLLDIAPAAARADLVLTVTEESPTGVAQAALRGDKPQVRIEGDVQLAADINWLVDNVRWDAEEDLSRLVGDAPAHALGDVGRRMLQALRSFAASRPPPARAGADS
jgi:ubiquinone biosynthesis protein UbiJ